MTKTEQNSRRSVHELKTSLAEYLIQAKVGQKIPSIRTLAEGYQASVGLVSAVLNEMEEEGAVSIQKRGHLGSELTGLSVARLWKTIEQKPLVLALTLPMHARFEGLATGLKMALDRVGIEAYLIFIRGSLTRLKALRDDRCHAAIMSGLAANELASKEEEVLYTLPPGSWLSSYSVFYHPDRVVNRPLRVAVDMESYDHRRLTDLEFAGQEIEFRKTTFVQISRLLHSGEVDATVWTIDQGTDFAGTNILNRPLSDHVRKEVGDASISATLVGHTNNRALRTLLQNVIDVPELMKIQNEIVTGVRIPEY